MVIYKITNILNGKIYIGQTTRKNPYKRFTDHFKKTRSKDLVRDAASKYGKENLLWEIIYCALDLTELNKMERFFINHYNSKVPNGYNIQNGGDGKGRWDEDTKKLNGIRVKEWYEKNDHPFKGKKFTDTHIQNLSKARKGFDSEARKIARQKTHKKKEKSILCCKIGTTDWIAYNSISVCANELNLDATCISKVLSGKYKYHKGYIFKFNS